MNYVTTTIGNIPIDGPIDPRIFESSAIALIAHQLAKIYRFNGAGVSVAKHSITVARDLLHHHGPRYALAGLLHDLPEFVTGDIVTPVIVAMGPTAQYHLHALHRRVWEAFRAGYALTDDLCADIDDPIVKEADMVALAAEWPFLRRPEFVKEIPRTPAMWSPYMMPPDEASGAFFSLFHDLLAASRHQAAARATKPQTNA